MKVVILGGSAQSTPCLWSYLINEARLRNLRVILVGRNRERIQAIQRACSMVAEFGGNYLEYSLLDEPNAWDQLGDTDIFLVQVRIGGYAGRSVDESFPLRYGICGDEGLGPGGLSAGLRNWQVIRPLLERIERLGPAPLVLILSSPVGLLVRAAGQAFPKMRIAGICELPWTTLLDICRAVGAEPSEIRFEYLGLNHLGWFYRLRVGGRDIVREFAQARIRESEFPSGTLIHSCGGVPLKYLRLHYEREKVVEEQLRQSQTRGEILEQLSRDAFRAYQTGDPNDVETALEARPAPWYRHAVGPLIAGLAGRALRIPFFLTVRNSGYQFHLNGDDMLECPHVIERGRLQRLAPFHAVPPHILDLTTRFVHYERLASAALLSGDPQDVVKAIEIHPWSDDLSRAAEMAHEILDYCRIAAA